VACPYFSRLGGTFYVTLCSVEGLLRGTKTWLPLVLWMGLIFLGSSLPGAAISVDFWVNFLACKAIHIFEYFVLAVLFAYRNACGSFSKLQVLSALGFSLLYAVTDELHQTFVPGRTGAWTDVVIDGLGAAAGLWLFRKRLAS